MSKRIFFEIFVDKNNEEWPAAFELIFNALHKVFDKHTKHLKDRSSFSFEIAKIWERIRFFITAPEPYASFVKNQIFAHYHNIEIHQVKDYLSHAPNEKIQIGAVDISKHYLYPIKDFQDMKEDGSKWVVDPFASITSALWRTGKYTITTFQVLFEPIDDHVWKKDSHKMVEVITSKYPDFFKKILLNKYVKYIKYSIYPVYGLVKLWRWMVNPFQDAHHDHSHESHEHREWQANEMKENFVSKISHPGFKTGINIIFAGEDGGEWRIATKEIASTLSMFSSFGNNSFRLKEITRDNQYIECAKARVLKNSFILNTRELSGLVHLPTSYVKTPGINWLSSRSFEPPANLPAIYSNEKNEITPLWKTNFRGSNTSFWILPDDRRRHMYVIWKTGMGKSTLLENMIIDDIEKGRGVALIDPHGDLAEAVIGYIPKNRTNQVIIFDPSDKEWPIAFNMLEDVEPEHRTLVASGLIWIFKKIFWESWGPRLEHTLRNTILALLEYPNTTLISIPLMLTSDAYRAKVVSKITDPVVKKYWTAEFGKLNPSQRTETINPILNKVWQFLSSPLLRNILGQPKNSFNLRWAMDNGKIIIVNLSKGKIGEDASSLLGAMLITKFQLDAMSRANIAEKERKDFYLYVDEFQNFATDSFATILSEARKYKLNLVMANQYIDQMPDEVKGAVFGNVGSLVCFQIWPKDAKILKQALGSQVTEEDLWNIKKYTIYLRELVDGMPSSIFSAETFPPHKKEESELKERYSKILQVSREKYCKPRDLVVDKIAKMMENIEEIEHQKEKFIEEKKKGKK